MTAATAIFLALLAGTGSVIGAWTGLPLRTQFMVEPTQARNDSLRFHLAHRNDTVWSARHGSTDIAKILPNFPSADVKIDVAAQVTRVGNDVPIEVQARGTDGSAAWGTVAVDFGDGRQSLRVPIVGSTTIHSAFSTPGDYRMSISVGLPRSTQVSRSVPMKVIAEDLIGPFSAQWIGGLAPEMLKHPVSVELESVTIGESRLELRGSSTSMWQDLAAADFWVWLIGYESGNLRANLYHADRAPALQERAGSRRAFTLVVSPTARPETGKLASVLLGISPQQGKPVRSRSGLFSFVWPSPVLTTGSPVVVTASEAR